MSPKSIEWQDREHFLIVASRHIREILVQSARRRYASKRSTAGLVEEQKAKDIVSLTREDLIGLEDVVSLLERVAPRAGQVVTLRIFGGLTLDEIAATLGVATVTV